MELNIRKLGVTDIIGKNSATVETTSHVMRGTGQEHINARTVLVPVSANDVLKLRCQNATGGRGVIGSTSVAYANSLMAHYLA